MDPLLLSYETGVMSSLELDSILALADDDLGEGKWITINGAHVFVGKDGEVKAGGKFLEKGEKTATKQESDKTDFTKAADALGEAGYGTSLVGKHTLRVTDDNGKTVAVLQRRLDGGFDAEGVSSVEVVDILRGIGAKGAGGTAEGGLSSPRKKGGSSSSGGGEDDQDKKIGQDILRYGEKVAYDVAGNLGDALGDWGVRSSGQFSSRASVPAPASEVHSALKKYGWKSAGKTDAGEEIFVDETKTYAVTVKQSKGNTVVKATEKYYG